MKVVKPMKIAVLSRVVALDNRTELHLAAALGFDLLRERQLADELQLWGTVQPFLGETGVLDECARKCRGEVLVAGSLYAPAADRCVASYAGIEIGTVRKRLSVIGNRWWRNGAPTDPEPFTEMAIDWRHAFGGPGYARNPHGIGIVPVEHDGASLQPLPNIEPYGRLARTPSERPDPAGFSPMDVTFAQRLARAGTYGKRWVDESFPGLPADVDPHFFNVAPEDQWIEGFWRGNEELVVENMHPTHARIEGRLPALVARSFVAFDGSPAPGPLVEVPMFCDTVWLFPSVLFGVVLFHGAIDVQSDDAAEIAHLVVACEEPTDPREIVHYQEVLARRLDKDEGAIAGLSDSDLMPPRTSGVSPNVEQTDVGRWVKSENIAAAKAHRGAVRDYEQARAGVLAEGLDPADFGLTAPPPPVAAPPPDDLDELAASLRAAREEAERERVAGEQEQARAKELARQQYAEMGLDYDEETEKAMRAEAGPPAFSAETHLAQMHAEVERAREEGVALDELERLLSDPAYHAQLAEQEQGLLASYRASAHLQSSPYPMTPEQSAQARVVAQAALDGGESLSERDFTGVDWSGMKLAGIDLHGSFLEASNLAGCDLEGANLERAVLAKADLRRANLKGAKLAGANLGGAKLEGADLEGADLSDAILSRAELGEASFREAKLAGADLLLTEFQRADLSGARLPGANILNADLSGCRFVGADLSDANLVECTLDGADFSRAKLHKTTLVTTKGENVCFREASFRGGIAVHGSELPGADFRDADMEKANLRGTRLAGAKLDRARLVGADLSECDCSGASFERAVLAGGMAIRAKLTRASLRGANLMDVLMSKAELQGADFTGANLARADLSRVIGDGETTFAEAEVAQVRFLPKAIVRQDGGAP